MATIGAFLKYFNAYPADLTAGRQKGDNMELNEASGKIEGRKESDGRLTLRVGGEFYSQFFNNRDLNEDTKEAMKACEIGETWDIGWAKGGDEGQFRNIITMEKVIDVNEGMPESTPAPKGMTKEQEIGFYALMKGVSPMISGNLQLFVDYAGGDFGSGWLKAREFVLDFVVDLQKEIKK